MKNKKLKSEDIKLSNKKNLEVNLKSNLHKYVET